MKNIFMLCGLYKKPKTLGIFFIPSNILVPADLVLYFKVFYQFLKSAVKLSYTF